ncbi:MAG: DUF2971 domain-containing protein [Pseudomonas sp.]|uniref:hypothetical protein n=1 Tax=Pseudomonas sp. TaxID=306 RepID=UPI003982C2B1
MAIHHYTKARILPLMLESGKIRFTRADCLDDKSEMPFRSVHVDPKNFFISSWTRSADEQSGQWYRYANAHTGVRITMPDMPFDLQKATIDLSRESRKPELAGKPMGIQIRDVALPYPISCMFGNGYVIYPASANPQDDFGGEVCYVNDHAEHVKKFISSDSGSTTILGGTRLARVKSLPWKDQAEYRFVLMAIAGPDLSYSESPSGYLAALYDLLETNAIADRPLSPPTVASIDLPFSAQALDSLVVTLGSSITIEDRDAVNQAVQRFAPNATVLDSEMLVR